ncbi:MAG TPA: diguanylate cyclase, partial [Coriobacteriia bacterium]|nr:diguanylate cyclase [Coriobacteriia bacterium]
MVYGLGTDDLALTALLESVVELVPDACLAALPDGRVLAANEKAAALYGRPVSRLVTMSESDLVARGSPTLFPRTRQELLAGVVFDSVHRDAGAAVRPVRVSARLSDLLGREVVIVTVLDDCEPVDAEEQRIKSAAFDAALDSIIVHDFDGNLLHFNQAAAEAAGMTAEEFSRLEPWGWTPAHGRAGRRERLTSVLEKGSHTFEAWGLRGDGSTYESEVHARALKLATGRTVIVAVVRDITERRRAETAIRTLAYHDALTGLPNRIALNERAEQTMADAERHGDLLGLAFVDINEFKVINDDIGHFAGDAVLRAIAERLVSAVRAGDTVARFGGDEFVIMLPRLADRADLERVGEKVARVVSGPLRIGDRTVTVTASVGLAVYNPAEDGFSSLLSKADMAMYSAKRAG